MFCVQMLSDLLVKSAYNNFLIQHDSNQTKSTIQITRINKGMTKTQNTRMINAGRRPVISSISEQNLPAPEIVVQQSYNLLCWFIDNSTMNSNMKNKRLTGVKKNQYKFSYVVSYIGVANLSNKKLKSLSRLRSMYILVLGCWHTLWSHLKQLMINLIDVWFDMLSNFALCTRISSRQSVAMHCHHRYSVFLAIDFL